MTRKKPNEMPTGIKRPSPPPAPPPKAPIRVQVTGDSDYFISRCRKVTREELDAIINGGKKMTLKDWAPGVLMSPGTRAYRLKDELVMKVFSRTGTWKPWPGKQTTVDVWCLLKNGLAVGQTKGSFSVSRFDDLPKGKIRTTETSDGLSLVKTCYMVEHGQNIVGLYVQTTEPVTVNGLAFLDHPGFSMSTKDSNSLVEFDDFEQPWECWGASEEKSGVKVTLVRKSNALVDLC